MFSTLRYDKITQAVELSELRPSRGACTQCRARKLRCSGQKTGCDRCTSRKVACEYPQPAKRKGPHHRSKQASQDQNENPSMIPTPDAQNQANSGTHSLPSLEWSEAAPVLDPFSANFDFDGPHCLLDPELDIYKMHVDTFNMGDNLDMFDSSQFLNLENDSLESSSLETTGTAGSPNSSSPTTAPESVIVPGSADKSSPEPSRPTSSRAAFASTVDFAAITAPTSRQSTISVSPPAVQASCQCLTNVSCLLETLSIEAARLNTSRVGRLLHLEKRILSQCDMLLGCPSCSGLSHYISLLIILCQNMANSFGQMLALLTDQYLRLQAQRNSTNTPYSHNDISNILEDKEQRIFVQDYDMDVEEEPCIFGALSLIQLKKLQILLGRIKHTARAWKWDSHIAVVESTEQQVSKQITMYDKNNGYAIKERTMTGA
ncbi:hypothetical protein DM02DRAFT_616147 [Periconia macrospinosa]|uniref:Zn(2)-C6 fungal-type domain-containing protein n=1 Tax=Periconia macrospinosa TaxID=97972 RepID=A0A2V1DK41_9PLEO|nr:hypothetical protein DM02DRAFT_616147 [Periconia macrospinosa]